MTDVDEIVAGLSPKTRKRVRMAQQVTTEKIETPSISLNSALKGGIGVGRQTLIWGNKSSGKTSMCLEMIGKAQRNNKICAFIDAENTYDPAWGARLGVENALLIHSPVKTVHDMIDVGSELMQSGVDLIVVDSISTLMPSSWFKDNELKGLDGTKQIGSDARDMANAVRMLNYSNEHTTLILISQIRNRIHSYGASSRPTGGNAVEFFSTTSIKLTSSARENDQIKGEVTVGDRIVTKNIGRPVTWQVEFNKLGPPTDTGKYNFYYDGDFVGVDTVGELVDTAERYGIVERKGAWYYFGDAQFNGKKNVVEFFKENPEEMQKVVLLINE